MSFVIEPMAPGVKFGTLVKLPLSLFPNTGVGSQIHIAHTLQRHAGLNNALSGLNLEELGRMARSLGLRRQSFVVFGLFDDPAMMNTVKLVMVVNA